MSVRKMNQAGLIGFISLIGFIWPIPAFAISLPLRPSQAQDYAGQALPVAVTAVPTGTPIDLTQPTKETKGRLEQILDQQHIESLGFTNFLQHAIRQAVAQGVPANTIVLLLLFPLVATIIAAARHFIGLRGFGVFTPAVVSVVFLATGLRLGMTLFFGILGLAMLGRMLLKQVRLQYLPQLAMLVWVMSLGILLLFVFSSKLGTIGVLGGLERLHGVGIFPILLLVLLTETFISAQISHGLKSAAKMTIETLVLAIISYFLMSMNFTQVWVLTHPELTMTTLAIVNILLGQFTGLRMLEYWRFRELLKK